ncbi:LLM class flavin-dependent oxidoreductase [Rhodohalobacter sulfatireducens]|uniref:LLM class flavin-dependent oxidoreductase n=1 Tax=Rhodohalobacter sulfatireducens TaxID=2911366 RepID=A0ABS9KGC8_9BACT|nr:LLM class flavin-dependent oxidoreductase [Rhodohalobacter sulfatireducens]MCG2589852.1 LLM class flavin-dependent oxidoreductase [Rhodohalobacter sulfatireducens]
MIHIPYSVLDLAVVTEGDSIREAIQTSRELAVHIEKLGYTRFWMAEHHNMENIASSATSILLGYVAEATKTIRVGSGGVMLPNHSPLVIAEQFGTLATIYPNRIDLGLGRAPGTDQVTANAIREDRMRQVQKFPENIKRLQNYFSSDNSRNKVRAIPGEGTEVPIWILGSSTDSAHLAAKLGLPYVFASHFAPQQMVPALRIYREQFEPSKQLDEPFVMPCVNIILADTDEQAEYLSTSMKQMMMGVVTGERKPMPPPVDDMNTVWSIHQKMAVEQMLRYSFIGSPATVKAEVKGFIEMTGAKELMIASYIYDKYERFKSYKMFADLMKEEINAVSSE